MTPDTRTTHPADGTLETRDGRHVLRYERRLAHPLERVWAALTQPSELRGWLADADLELVEGGRVQLRWLNTDDEGNAAVADGTVTALDPPRLVEFATEPHGVLRASYIYWSSFADNGQLVRGRWVHPVTGGSLAFAGARGLISMLDAQVGYGVRTTYHGRVVLASNPSAP